MLSEANTILRFNGFDPRDIDTSRVWRSSVAICLVVLIVGSIGPVGKQPSGYGVAVRDADKFQRSQRIAASRRWFDATLRSHCSALLAIVNRAGKCVVVTPNRITLRTA